MTPIKGRLGKNTTPTCRRTAALTPNLQKDSQQRRPDFDDSSYPDSGYASEKTKYTKHKPHSNETAIYKKIKALGKLVRTFQILHQSALKTFAPFQENQKSNGRSQELCLADHMDEPYPTLCNDELIYSAQAMLLQESDQLGWNAHSGYIATRLERHSAGTPLG